MKVAFDINGTLLTLDDKPNYPVIELLRWFQANGDDVFVWSGSGVEYAKLWVEKLGLENVSVREKGIEGMDIAVDDMPDCKLGKSQIIIGGQHV